MLYRHYALVAVGLITSALPSQAQPTAIFHAFNQSFTDIQPFVCQLADQGYSHLQLSPTQTSNPGPEWWKRYQPTDYSTISGLGTETQLKELTTKAHSCNIKVIADVVFNHVGNLDGKDNSEDITQFPNLTLADFNTSAKSNPITKPCDITYNDGNRNSELTCWLGGLPDLKFTPNVKKLQKAHLKKLLTLGIDGFRFDAAKHMPQDVMQEYINYVNEQSNNKTWNYLEVISDSDTRAEDYNSIAAVTDFTLYNSMKQAFSFGGDLRSLPATATTDPRSVTFGQNHDTIRSLNSQALNPYDDITDAYLADAYVLARRDGTPLVFNEDNFKAPYIPFGVKFRQIMGQRANPEENILRVTNSPTVMIMERGAEGFVVINKGTDKFDVPVLDLTLSKLEGCYRELRNGFTVAIERKDNKKFVTRWGTPKRGGLEIQGRDALYFIREPFDRCK